MKLKQLFQQLFIVQFATLQLKSQFLLLSSWTRRPNSGTFGWLDLSFINSIANKDDKLSVFHFISWISVRMIIVLCGQPSRKTAWLQLVTSPFIHQLSPTNNLTALRDGCGRTRTFWETPRIVSLAEKNSRPKPPGTGSKSMLGVCVRDKGLHRSGRTC